MSALDFLRDIGKHFRVNTMIRKEAVAARLDSDEGISYTEFSYQILQGLDYLHLFREYGCTLQTGGQDQWGNLTAGTDLIRRVTGESVHLLATPLITDATARSSASPRATPSGCPRSMTSPYAFYQYWFNVEDASVGQLLRVFTDRTGRTRSQALERAGRWNGRRPARRSAPWPSTSPRWCTARRPPRRRSRRAPRCSAAASSDRWTNRRCAPPWPRRDCTR